MVIIIESTSLPYCKSEITRAAYLVDGLLTASTELDIVRKVTICSSSVHNVVTTPCQSRTTLIRVSIMLGNRLLIL